MARRRSIIANRVFVAYPWKTYRAVWENHIDEWHKRYPVHFMAIGREAGQPAAELLAKILDALDRSSCAFLDASGGNPNVSLEYGYSKSLMEENEIFLFWDENSSSSSSPGAPIISDLAGTVANRFTLDDKRLKESVEAIVDRHFYNRRFQQFCRQRKYRGGTRRFLIRLIRQLDGRDSILRREFLDNVIHESRRTESYVDKHLKELHKGGLMTITRGNEYSSRITIAG
jgi:hypothetical protein